MCKGYADNSPCSNSAECWKYSLWDENLYHLFQKGHNKQLHLIFECFQHRSNFDHISKQTCNKESNLNMPYLQLQLPSLLICLVNISSCSLHFLGAVYYMQLLFWACFRVTCLSLSNRQCCGTLCSHTADKNWTSRVIKKVSSIIRIDQERSSSYQVCSYPSYSYSYCVTVVIYSSFTRLCPSQIDPQGWIKSFELNWIELYR